MQCFFFSSFLCAMFPYLPSLKCISEFVSFALRRKAIASRFSSRCGRVAVKPRLESHAIVNHTVSTSRVATRPLNNFVYLDKMHRRIVVAYAMRSHLCDKNEYKTTCKRSQEWCAASTCAAFLIVPATVLFRLDCHR